MRKPIPNTCSKNALLCGFAISQVARCWKIGAWCLGVRRCVQYSHWRRKLMAAIRKDTRDTPSTFPELRSDVDTIHILPRSMFLKRHAEVALAPTFSRRDWFPSRNQPTYVVMGEWGHWPPFHSFAANCWKEETEANCFRSYVFTLHHSRRRTPLRTIHFTPFKGAHALDSAWKCRWAAKYLKSLGHQGTPFLQLFFCRFPENSMALHGCGPKKYATKLGSFLPWREGFL